MSIKIRMNNMSKMSKMSKMSRSYLLDPRDLVFMFEKNITSLSALVSR
jgi:hypothetical protein